MSKGGWPMDMANIGLRGKFLEEIFQLGEEIKKATGEYPTRAQAVEVLASLGCEIVLKTESLDWRIALVDQEGVVQLVILPSVANLIRQYFNPRKPRSVI